MPDLTRQQKIEVIAHLVMDGNEPELIKKSQEWGILGFAPMSEDPEPDDDSYDEVAFMGSGY